jgi:serine/threonine-protein phosphatase PGAM5
MSRNQSQSREMPYIDSFSCAQNTHRPAPIIPIRPEIDATDEIDQNYERIEAAFQKYIYRANPSFDDDNEHEFEVIVCHGNVIRFFFCRALQIPPEAWLRMSIFNCSLTYIMVKPNGHCTCRMLGDIGHLGYEHTTFSNGYGFAWS